MAVPVAKHSFDSGEISPVMLGRQDNPRYGAGATTARNFFVHYDGGLFSRAGTAFCGYSKQTGRNYPPRLIPFQFSNNQGLALEFGNNYMRVLSNGAFVTDDSDGISSVTTANPLVVQVLQTGTLSATPIVTGVIATYNPGDTITLAGGVYSLPAKLQVATTQVVSAEGLLALPGLTQPAGYVPGDTVTLAGGTYSSAGVLTVASTQVTTATLASGGTGGTNGYSYVTGTTGTGTKFQAYVQISGGAIVQVVYVAAHGNYTVNPSNLSAEPVTGSGLSGATLSITMGPNNCTVTTAGSYSVNPAGFFNQASTSGSGTNATFFPVMGPLTVSVVTPGSYTSFPSNPVAQASTSGTGTGVTFTCTHGTVNNFAVGDWLYFSGVGGTTQLNNNTFVIASVAGNNFTMNDVFGNPVDASTWTAYTSGGTASRIYTLPTVYGEQDLPWIKVVQSADTMSVCCVNSNSGSQYSAYDLVRNSDTDWTFEAIVPDAYVSPPSPVSGGSSGSGTVQYQYVITAIDPVTGTESVASSIATISNAVDIASVAGSNTVFWTSTNPNVKLYYIYKALPAYSGATIPAGSLFGFAGQSSGGSFVDSNIVADYSQVPPTHQNPFASNNPSVPAYFQERRGYANSLNNPDTYWFSQPGAFTNFDTRNPTIASDAITGSPWAVQVNGVQWMIQTSGGLLVMTGLRAWLLVGAGSFATNVEPISPSNQNDVPQAFTGVSSTIQPIEINYDVLYVEATGVYYYDLPYQLYALSEPIDLTDISQHLFQGYTVVANCYCEKPYRIIWSVRSDGALLSLTYYKTQKLQGWTRHDTQGLFVGCCSILEGSVNAAYFATQRFVNGQKPYMIERMNNRTWTTAENVWAVDAGLSYPQPTPAATLTISSATGLGAVTGASNIVGGSGYSAATTGTVVDQFGGTGSGAVPTLTFTLGALTSVSFAGGSQGSGYTNPLLVLNDPAGSAGGSGASATLTLTNTVTLTASASVFSNANVGSFVRAARGVAVITGYSTGIQVTANVLTPFSLLQVPGSTSLQTVASGAWTMTAPTTTVTGLNHLIGATVTGLADGNVIPPTTVSATGSITLATAASAITVGLGFQAQFQDVPIDLGNPTVQGQRKKIAATSLRLHNSRGVKVGTNQPDGSQQSPPLLAMTWTGMQPLPDSGPGAPNFPPAPYNALCTPLRTGDVRTATQGGIATPGQLCVQQDNPLPCEIIAIYSEVITGDTPAMQAPAKPQGRR